MRKGFAFILTVVGIALTVAKIPSYQEYIEQHKSSPYAHRYTVEAYQKNVADIMNHNTAAEGGKGFLKGVNHMSGLHHEELKEILGLKEGVGAEYKCPTDAPLFNSQTSVIE